MSMDNSEKEKTEKGQNWKRAVLERETVKRDNCEKDKSEKGQSWKRTILEEDNSETDLDDQPGLVSKAWSTRSSQPHSVNQARSGQPGPVNQVWSKSLHGGLLGRFSYISGCAR